MVRVSEPVNAAVMPGFNSEGAWALAQRIAKGFASSDLVPATYKNNVANCIVALEMANRMGASPLMVMQNLYVVHGNPGWSSKFLIASFNQCGRFTAIRYEWSADKSECTAWATEKSTGERITGPKVTLEMAKAEQWSTKNGSKWKTMPDLMLMYRAAAFLIRTYAPEISMGLMTAEEVEDVTPPVKLRSVQAWGTLLPAMFSQARAEIENRVTTADDVIAKAHLDPDGEQAQELRRIEKAAA